MTLSRGRDILAIPGPSIIPDRVLQAMHRPAPNIYEGELVTMTGTVLADLRRVARTDGSVAVYIGNGHAGWEAAVANMLAPGHKALVVATGRFGLGWAATARQMGIDVEVIDFGFRAGIDADRVADRLRADHRHEIRAVLAVQTDTASSVLNDVPALRAALDAAGHSALLAIDSIACLACDRLEMDAWGVDVVVAGSQKGLMTPPGLTFTFQNERALRQRVPCPSPYWDWGPRVAPDAFYQLFCGTAPTHHLYGLRTALDMILRGGPGPRLVPPRRVRTGRVGGGRCLGRRWGARTEHARPAAAQPRGDDDPDRARGWYPAAALVCRHGRADAGHRPGGRGDEADSVFRIGHMGHLNPPMLLGTLATIEAGLQALGIRHGAEGPLRRPPSSPRPARRRRPTQTVWKWRQGSSRSWLTRAGKAGRCQKRRDA